jgi:deoxyribose-phosphate aldolase
MVTYEEIAQMIDHSLLNPVLSDKDIINGCNIARDYKVKSVCCRPSDLKLVKEKLGESNVLITSVIGFPHGSTTTNVKVCEANEAIDNGSQELDMVLNIGKLRSGDYEYVKNDIKAVNDLCHKRGVITKVIFENCFLNTEQKITACKICNEVGVDYVKTSTGYGTGGAIDEDIKLMRKYANPEIKIKAAGGIRTLERAIEIKELGVSRFGATATVEILESLKTF